MALSAHPQMRDVSLEELLATLMSEVLLQILQAVMTSFVGAAGKE